MNVKTNLFFLLILNLIFFASIIYAKKIFSKEFNEMERRSLDSRVAAKEPEFFVTGSSTKWVGFYFGVGFRKIRLNVSDNIIISDTDGEANGIGINLGYFWEEQSLEFERQTSIVKHKKTFSYEGQEGKLLEVIQNNFWYIQYPKINRYFFLHYGTGIQFNKIRFAGTETRSSYKDEVAVGIETGFSYFITSNMLILYRFSLGQEVPFFTNSDSKTFLNQSQIHTIFLNYYFPL